MHLVTSRPVPRRSLLFAGIALALTAAARPAPSPVEWSEPARLASRALLLDAAAAGDRLVAVGERGIILVSTDRGASWKQARVPTRTLLTGVFMHDAKLGWAVGHDETILRTHDGGGTWELLHSDPAAEKPLLDIWFRDIDHGFAVGAYGDFLRTDDGGDTWHRQTISQDDFHLNQIAAAGDGTLYIAAEAGHFYRSADGGATWTALPTPYDGSFFGVLPTADGGVLIFGLRGKLFRSADRGTTWTGVATGTEATLMTGLELAPGQIVVAGLAGAVLVSEDSGRTFEGHSRADRLGGVALAALDGRVWLFGEDGPHALEVSR